MTKKADKVFKADLQALGVDESIIDAVMEIHTKYPELVPYECKRKYNIIQNEEKLKSLNLFDFKSELKATAVKKPVKRKTWSVSKRSTAPLEPSRKSARPRRSTAPLEPSRKSARIAGIDPINYQSENVEGDQDLSPSPPKKKPSLSLKDIVDVKSDLATPIIDFMKNSSVETKTLLDSIKETRKTDQIVKEVSEYSTDEAHIARLCKSRLSSMAVHPGNQLLVAGGSKWGEVGLGLISGGNKTTVRLEAHQNVVGGCQFVGDKLVTSSYDGSARVFDPNSLQFDEIFDGTPDDVFLRSLDSRNNTEVLINTSIGQVIKLDVRVGHKVVSRYPKEDPGKDYGSLWYIHHNPCDNNYFITSSNNANIVAWDHRSSTNPVAVCDVHTKTVSSAKFDPIHGNTIVSVAYDDKIGVLDFTSKSEITQVRMTSHYNNTGRWLTKFQAHWYPHSSELFTIGSMSRPRRVELYNIAGGMETAVYSDYIGSVMSIPEFHPTLDALFCGNGSGYCYVLHG